MISEHEGKLSQESIQGLNNAIAAAKESQTSDEIKSAIENITNALSAAGSQMYENSSSETGGSAQDSEGEDEDIIDVEVTG